MDLSNKPFDEIVLRLYPGPSNFKGRDLVKKACLSCGLLNPGDSRDVIVDVLTVLAFAKKNKEWLSSVIIGERVVEMRLAENWALDGTAGSNIRRILKLLRDYGFVVKENARYQTSGNLVQAFQDVLDKRVNKIIDRNKAFFKALNEF